ncbi:hypothetical protein EZV73_27785 [Acidaminobacter sp. JC074]|uniref:hypothetical protein n=1 Tax=Acidaminobacter sp. JC074 TaxID=2530199 RepID=UPI001F110843|nr:hypothetical protein [Acidaminobacter sp. JC074]MCH4891403.1 hypothetical protein [Acidaminobacter sp. JC074]
MNREQARKLKSGLKKSPYKFRNTLQSQILRSSSDDLIKLWKIILEDQKLQKMVNANYLPSSIDEFGKSKFMFEPSANNVVITQWVINLIIFYSEKINGFITLKRKYENALFCEKYDIADKILGDIEKDICISMWSICQKFVLEEKINGLEGNKRLLSTVMKKTERNPLLAILLEHSSVRAEENMSYLNYQDQAIKYLRSLEGDEIIYKYCDLKINNEYMYSSDVFGIALQLDAQMSIIDIYESFIKLIQYESISNIDVIDITESMSEFIDDFRIRNLLIRVSSYEQSDNTVLSNQDSILYKYLDMYSKGNYSELACEYEKENLEKDIDFQSLIVYIKSCLNSKREISLELTIIKLIENIYSVKESSTSSVNQLYNYLKMYKETRWYDKLRGFLNHKLEVESNGNLHYLSLINDLYLSPNYVEFIESDNEKIRYLDRFAVISPITASLFTYKYSLKDHDEIYELADPIRRTLFEADANIYKGNYPVAISKMIELSNMFESDYNNIYEKSLVRLFKAYCLNGDYYEAVKLTVDTYFTNSELIRKFDTNSIITRVKRTRNINLKKSIYSPIFCYIAQPLNFKNQRVVLSNFMGHNNFLDFDDLFKSGGYDVKLLSYCVHKICTLHFLNREPQFAKTPEEAEDIRIKLLWNLLDIDAENQKQYYEEISKIMLEKSIRSNISKINKSKISVEVEKIKSEHYDILNENFEKYLSMKDFGEEYRSVDITSNEYIEDILNIATKVKEKIRTDKNYNQQVIVLRKILVRITEEFLFNTKYGLDTYLSSRIRHGYCRYQLTDSFIDYNLLSKTRSNDSKDFVENEYWDSQLIDNEVGCSDKFKSYISTFTGRIENKVSEVKDQWIKIRYKGDDEGLLDFTLFIQSFLSSILLYDDNFDDFEMFFNYVIKELWIWLEASLEKLRDKIRSELYTYFIEELNALEKDIQSIEEDFMRNVKREVLQNINLCKRKIENDTKEFANVLYKNDITYKDFYMDALVSTSTEISSKLNSNFKNVKLNKKITVNDLVDGRLFPYFVDILTMLITNANVHSGYSELKDLDIEIGIDLVENLDELEIDYEAQEISYGGSNKSHVRISVRNSLSPTLDLKEVQDKISEKIDNLRDKDIVRKHSRLEGGTGIYKIYNILRYNISGKSLIASHANPGEFVFKIYIPYETVVKGE